MKKLFLKLIAATMMILVVGVSSCGDDDENGPPPGPSEYTVTFNSNQGVPAVTSVTVDAATPVAKPEDPTKEHLYLVGWYTDNNRWENEWNFSNPVHQDFTLYARWADKVFVVTFEYNIEDPDHARDPRTVNRVSGQTVNRPSPDPTWPGWIFEGWFYDGEEWDFEDAILDDITINAVWRELMPSKVTFHTNGGSAVAEQNLWAGELVVKPDMPTKNSDVFVGWFKDEQMTEWWDFATDAVEEDVDVDLYAKWNDPDDPSSGNLVKGWRMEEGDADNWTVFWSTGTAFQEGTPTNVLARFGYQGSPSGGSDGSLVLYNIGSSGHRVFVYQEIDVEPGKRYRFTYQFKYSYTGTGGLTAYFRAFIANSLVEMGAGSGIWRPSINNVSNVGNVGPFYETSSDNSGHIVADGFDGEVPTDPDLVITGLGRCNGGTCGEYTAVTDKAYIVIGLHCSAAVRYTFLIDNVIFEEIED